MAEFDALDATATKVRFSVTQDSNGLFVGSSCETDPITGAKKQVGTQYGVDNQNFTGAAALETSINLDFNGQGFDRHRNNIDFATSAVTVQGAAAQTINGPTQTNYNHKGVQLGVNVSQLSASTTITIAIQGQDVVSGTWYTLLTSAALNAVAFTQMTIYPGLVAAANTVANQVLPRTWRVVATIAGAGTATATVGASVIM